MRGTSAERGDQLIVEHSDAEVRIDELGGGQRQITVVPKSARYAIQAREFATRYPVELIEHFLRVKGPADLCDEIMRDEDDAYTRACLEKDIFGYLPDSAFSGKRLLDFGCGAGASTMILARMLPRTNIIGVELNPDLIELAALRRDFYGFDHLTFLRSPSGDRLPEGIGSFDFVVLSAVYEHLLPRERATVLDQLWRILKPGGRLFVNQTPFRFFPFEGHTTQLPFVNYMPDKMALWAARKFSKRVAPNEPWEQLLRRGIRGGTAGEILEILARTDGSSRAVLLEPSLQGLADRVDLWYAGYAVSIANRYPRVAILQRILRDLFKGIYRMTGLVLVPALSLAIEKRERE